jgi:hypothetical protein
MVASGTFRIALIATGEALAEQRGDAFLVVHVPLLIYELPSGDSA